jgi:hypothetical protein
VPRCPGELLDNENPIQGSQMNAIGGFSARLNGVRQGHPAKMSSRQKLTCGLSGTQNDDVENQSRTGAAGAVSSGPG